MLCGAEEREEWEEVKVRGEVSRKGACVGVEFRKPGFFSLANLRRTLVLLKLLLTLYRSVSHNSGTLHHSHSSAKETIDAAPHFRAQSR